ncbi:hypothetical protein FB45DRAFT_948060 [Roridomyces roridus]|uniref:MYND-type domain-containing protein n=1 Tax=Roridomyces roridus TaxID=1738132 RepID=A0AAD7B195_9AGAR|nr:hypothetical protein FB45DRAFT_948060 [Roridomyces roridus]
MAAGSETEYKLDLDDIIAFPDAAHVPVLPPEPGESWIIFGEIVNDASVFRPVYTVRDKINCEYPVAFYTDNPNEDAKAAGCQLGRVLCITNGMRHHFVDGSNGYRIEDPSTVFALPCSMAELRALNKRLRDQSDAGELQLCSKCKKQSTQRCGKCQTAYCSKECQSADWKPGAHRFECRAIERLRIWNRTDWG